MSKTVFIDDELMQCASNVLDTIGLDVDTVVRMTLKRVVRDGGISFLIANAVPADQQIFEAITNEDENKIRVNKTNAVVRFRESGCFVSKNATFASNNRATNNYWANPPFEVLKQDWYLILHDRQKRELHLFMIPAGAVMASDLVSRNDREDRVDLQIYYNDPTYTDSRSKISFSKFLVKSIQY